MTSFEFDGIGRAFDTQGIYCRDPVCLHLLSVSVMQINPERTGQGELADQMGALPQPIENSRRVISLIPGNDVNSVCLAGEPVFFYSS